MNMDGYYDPMTCWNQGMYGTWEAETMLGVMFVGKQKHMENIGEP